MKVKAQIDYEKFKIAATVLRSFRNKIREKIIALLQENQKMTVTEIYVKLSMEQAVVSQHLATLLKSGIVTVEKNGKFRYYQLDKEKINEISLLVDKLAVYQKD